MSPHVPADQRGARGLWLVRHGESAGNVAASAAERAGVEQIEITRRDADVELSGLGEAQARALGEWIATAPTGFTVYSSPYLRARQTIDVALAQAGIHTAVSVDERLRDRELGILDTLTSWGVERRHPDEHARKRHLGKFYYRAPGGESWADVALRIRSFLRDLDAAPPGAALVVAHDAVIMLFLFVCLGLTERELLDFAAGNNVANASVTRLSRGPEGVWSLASFSDRSHLVALGTPATEHPGEPDVYPH